jgi:hypothetical protein
MCKPEDAITAEQAECWQKMLDLARRQGSLTIKYSGLSTPYRSIYLFTCPTGLEGEMHGTEEEIRSWLMKS